jgi:hypothetical protein
MVNHHRPTWAQLWNTPGYHHELSIRRRRRPIALLLLRRHDELLSVMTTQRTILPMHSLS